MMRTNPPRSARDGATRRWRSGLVRLRILLTTRVDIGKPADLAQGKMPKGRVTLDGFLGFWDEVKKAPLPPESLSNDKRIAFALNLLDLVEVQFQQLRLNAQYETGGDVKPQLTPKIQNVAFLGPLKFVQKFQEYLKNLGGGFRLDITLLNVAVSLQMQVPPIAFGVFALKHIELGAGLELSFEEKPLRFRFNFAEWSKPFELSVLCFSGRGFFRATLQSDGTRELEGALEFGGSLSFNVVVASGGLYVMAGVYFRITNSTTELSGYLRAGGNLDVLGLIHASVEFLLMVRYVAEGGQQWLYGTCTITVSIDLLFFSADVHITMEKKIAGSSDPPPSPNAQLLKFSAAPARGNTSEPPLAYFSRNSSETKKKVPGRFASAYEWNRDYWSQFAFPR
jgi:hypothetical protein